MATQSAHFESLLLDATGRPRRECTARVVIVGSGYGGSVAASRLDAHGAQPRREHGVLVLERGREYALGEFPTSMADVARHVRLQRGDGAPAGSGSALFEIRTGTGVDVLTGSGLGGTSLINANVAIEPDWSAIGADADWPTALRAEAADPDSPLRSACGALRTLLGAETLPAAEPCPKRDALRHFGHSLGFHAEAAPITVRLQSAGRNAAGVDQAQCTRCGNCVTGCNVGAKGALTMNLIPAARARGAQFLTGANVLQVVPHAGGPDDPKWEVRVAPTAEESRARLGSDFRILADVVILAAGALGSTEILLRSDDDGAPRFSGRLGARFSTNGDGLSASYAQKELVQAVGVEDFRASAAHSPGPTITTIVKGRTRAGERSFLLEDGSIPHALRGVIAETLTTSAQFGRLGRSRLPAWLRRHRDRDPLAVHADAQDRSQIFLLIGPEDTSYAGSLQLKNPTGERRDAFVVPVWQKQQPAAPDEVQPADDVAEDIHDTVAQGNLHAGLDHGQYVTNPLWRLFPREATQVMSGATPAGRHITVHPLGGCPMADDADFGVVDHAGQVFDAASGLPHAGLYVLDGSIIPGGVGANPFITIGALAWRACEHIARREGLLLHAPKLPDAPLPGPASLDPVFVPAPPRAARTAIREQLTGHLEAVPAFDRQKLRHCFPTSDRWFAHDGLVLSIRTVAQSIAPGESQRLPLVAELHENPVPADVAQRQQLHGSPVEHLSKPWCIAQGSGHLTVMAPDAPRNPLQWAWRTGAAIVTYRRRRGFGGFLPKSGSGGPWLWLWRLVKSVGGFIDVAAMHATYRRFDYVLELQPTGATDAAFTLRISGSKVMAWRQGNRRLWQSLLELPTQVRLQGVSPDGVRLDVAARATFHVNTDYLTSKGILRLYPEPGRDHVAGYLDLLHFGSHFARAIVQSSFWEFAAPDYPKQARLPVPRPQAPDTLVAGGHTFHKQVLTLSAWSHAERGAMSRAFPVRLSGYRHAAPAQTGAAPRQVALLIHGLAQGGLIYAHHAQPHNMAQHLLEAGFDVWLLDYRLSNIFGPDQVPYGTWSIDDIAREDIPKAVEALRAHYDHSLHLHVFAHCVGAVAIAMAILEGRLTRLHIQSLALNAIHPWTMPSPANRFRAQAVGFARDLLDDSIFNPLIPSAKQVTATQSLFDRVAYSASRLYESEDSHGESGFGDYGSGICDRMTFLYGRMWRHENSRGVHDHWHDLVGRAPGSVQRHLYQLVANQRLLDHEGRNIYLQKWRIRLFWRDIPTLFMHGDESDVFNPQSASRSAVRLSQALTDHGREPASTPVWLKRIPGYGHMDVILADDAVTRSFPYITAFFRGAFDAAGRARRDDGTSIEMDRFDAAEDLHGEAARMLTAGWIVRRATMHGDQLQLRLWLETRDDITCPVSLDGALIGSGQVPWHEMLPPPHATIDGCYHWMNVRLPPTAFASLQPALSVDR